MSSETTAGDCDGSYTVTRVPATDVLATARCPQTITVEDTTALSSRAFLPTTRWSAGRDAHGRRHCVNNCNDEHHCESETIAGDAAGNYTIIRVHCDGRLWQQHFCDQTIAVEATTAPELSIPADYTAECSDELILDDATASTTAVKTMEVVAKPPRRLRRQLHGDAHVHCDGRRRQRLIATQTITVEDTRH